MADCKELVPVTDAYSPDFIEELLPCSQQVSLLYHVSYLCVGGFPKLEGLLRSQAVETRLLFGDSEALLLKCIGTSNNFTTTLFPMLTTVVNENQTDAAVSLLEEAETWIKNVIVEVDKIIERYNQHNRDVAKTTNEIITVKKETEDSKTQLSKETESIEKTLQTLKDQHNQTNTELGEKEKQLDDKTHELREHIKSVTATDTGLSIFAVIVPFFGMLTKAIYNAATGPGAAEKTKALEIEINKLIAEKNFLKQKEWNLQLQEIDWNMKLAKLKIDSGVIPDPVHLVEVQGFLTRIQEILLQLKIFWAKIGSMLSTLKDKTFLSKKIICYKNLVLMSIEAASKAWKSFGAGCAKGAQIFKEQNKDAYNFLQIDPSTLKKDVWQSEYESVMSQLKNINVSGENKAPAIEEKK